jgi:FtsP/CotA-like multicopper oxidase with cupredoxin domain
MIGRKTKRAAIWTAATVGAATVAMSIPLATTSTPAAAAGAAKDGIVCTNGSGGAGAANFVITSKTGYITTPDGNSIYAWGLSPGNGKFQHPGPVLCVNEGDKVSITLNNTLKVPTSLQFVGVDGVQANGKAANPQFTVITDGGGTPTGANLDALTDQAAAGGSITYSFVAAKPGTYLYQSGTDPELQVQMGLFGALVVRPQGDRLADVQYAYDHYTPGATPADPAVQVNEPLSKYSSKHEYMVMLSEVDPDIHVAVEKAGGLFTMGDYKGTYHARYFEINGRSFPDTIAPNNAPWLPSQPYGALARVEPFSPTNSTPALLRYLSVGPKTYPFHPHSNHEKVIGIDGRFLGDGNADLSSEKFAVVVNPGQTQDATFVWTNTLTYSSASNPVPVAPPSNYNLTEGDFWSGTPYLGEQGGFNNPAVNTKDACGEYYHVAHNHDLTQVTNYGVTFGGMLTLIRVDPPGGNTSPACNG